MVAQRMVALTVTAVLPNGVSLREFQAYVEDAVGTMKGSGNPEEPLFDLDSSKVRATMPRVIAKVE
jgi:hypothetical protein